VANRTSATIALVLFGASACLVSAADKTTVNASAGWDRQAAARYLDSREAWWQGWDRAQKDHGTVCVSCHTQAPYALARPALRDDLGDPAPSAAEQTMLASIEKRVRGWKQMLPFYSDEKYGTGKEIESRAAESVLNASILASYDGRQGRLSETARTAFDNAWELQLQTGPDAGAWTWQNFDYTPWESKESQYHWAALMAVAVGKECGRVRHQGPAPLLTDKEQASYCADTRIAAHIALLTGFLRSHFEAQPLLNKLVALWADSYFSGIVTMEQERNLIANLDRLQHEDGGWSLTDLGTWDRRDKTPLETRSDGYASGLIVLVWEERVVHTKSIPQVARGIAWLVANQDKSTGAWPAWSLNKNRDLESDVGKFMSDAATSYAVLALEAQR
jgi:hypothetical protein